MGGTVAEVIRTKDGQCIKMARKTGAYNWFLFSKNFNDETISEEISLNEHCKVFFEMKEDFLSGEPYEFPMSPVYGWANHIAPTDYGLVVIDFQNKKIHSMQGYDKPGKLTLSNISPFSKNKELNENHEFLVNNNLLYVYDSTLQNYNN